MFSPKAKIAPPDVLDSSPVKLDDSISKLEVTWRNSFNSEYVVFDRTMAVLRESEKLDLLSLNREFCRDKDAKLFENFEIFSFVKKILRTPCDSDFVMNGLDDKTCERRSAEIEKFILFIRFFYS